MKLNLALAGLLSLTACGSASKPDARINQIHDLHQQVLAQQKPLEETEKDPIMLRYGHLEERQKRYNDLVKTSQEIIATIDQLDAGKSQEPAQVQLVAEALTREQAVASLAADLVKHNKTWIVTVAKSNKMLDSLKHASNSKVLNLH